MIKNIALKIILMIRLRDFYLMLNLNFLRNLIYAII